MKNEDIVLFNMKYLLLIATMKHIEVKQNKGYTNNPNQSLEKKSLLEKECVEESRNWRYIQLIL